MSIPKSVTKAHATGNDFIAYLDSDGRFEPTADEVRQLCDRHFGIGADGLLRLTKPQYVADLSEAQVAERLSQVRRDVDVQLAVVTR